MLGGVTLHMLPHLPGVPHLHVNRPLTSFWYRGPGELGNGLLSVRSGGDTRGTLVLISEYNDKNFNFVSLKVLNFIAHLYRWRHLMNRFMPFLVNCFMSAAQNDSIFKVEKKCCLIKKRSDDVDHKNWISEIMELVDISRKNTVKNVHLLKLRSLVQIGAEL